MSKTFKSAGSDNRELEVDVLFGNPRLLIKDFDGGIKGFIFGKADAPALALAILEAAGVVPENRVFREGSDEHLQCIAYDLTRYLDKSAERAVEVMELAELEAEALELLNAAIRQGDGAIYDSFSRIPTPDLWLAVARKAREMRAEK